MNALNMMPHSMNIFIFDAYQIQSGHITSHSLFTLFTSGWLELYMICTLLSFLFNGEGKAGWGWFFSSLKFSSWMILTVQELQMAQLISSSEFTGTLKHLSLWS